MSDHEEDWDTLIEVSPAETRVALVDDDGLLRRLRIDRIDNKSPVGAIYRARVKKIEKSTAGAFVDLGAPALGDAFLPKYPKGLSEGQLLTVQITRASDALKGVAINTRPVLRGRYVSYYPKGGGVTLDRRCGQGRRRAELEILAVGAKPHSGGLMVNWPAVAAEDAAVAREIQELVGQWQAVEVAFDKAGKPGLLLAAPDALTLALLDAPPSGRSAVDDRRCFADMKKTAETKWPDLLDGLLFHDPRDPIFAAAGIEAEIELLCDRVVPIPGGGSLSIDPVEAMTVIDVNLADTAMAPDGFSGTVKLNLRAAAEVARQIELRNLSGLIVVDFVSMRNKEDRKKIVDATRKHLRTASVPTDVLGMTAAGLVEITRQRTGAGLTEQLLSPVSPAGSLPAADAAAILRKLVHMTGGGRPVVTAPADVIELLKSAFLPALEETEARIGQKLTLEVQTSPGWDVTLQR
ncbi:MAG: ribonuclease E/G [Alphaproteobacteria bacterium]